MNGLLPPLPERLRPHSLEDYVGQQHLVGKGCILRNMIESGNLSSFILWGPPGVGKTTLARIIADSCKREFFTLSAISAGVKDAKEALRHIETSGFPFLIQVKIIVTQVATAGAIVVVTKIEARDSLSHAAAPLKPYQPNQRIKQPSAPKVTACPGIALTFLTFPLLSFMYFPSRGPTIIAPISAVIPPTECIAALPAKSWKPSLTSQPFSFQTQPASIG